MTAVRARGTVHPQIEHGASVPSVVHGAKYSVKDPTFLPIFPGPGGRLRTVSCASAICFGASSANLLGMRGRKRPRREPGELGACLALATEGAQSLCSSCATFLVQYAIRKPTLVLVEHLQSIARSARVQVA